MQKQQSKSGAFDGKTTAKADKPPSVDNRVEKVTKADDLNSLFDKQREKLESGTTKSGGGALGMGGVLGFGFRGTIPKLPSFKVSKLANASTKVGVFKLSATCVPLLCSI